MKAQLAREKLWYLRQVDLFTGVDEREMRTIAERSQMREIPRGHVILRPDERSEIVYVIKAGRVKVSHYSPDGREQILALLDTGDIFGELALVGTAQPVTVEAFEDTLVCGLHRSDFLSLVERRPELLLHVMKALAERLRVAEEEIADLVFRDVPGRLAALLLRLAEAYGRAEAGRLRLTLRLTHQDMASMIGATRETVTAVLGRFREDGVIQLDRRQVVIRDPAGLRRLSAPRS